MDKSIITGHTTANSDGTYSWTTSGVSTDSNTTLSDNTWAYKDMYTSEKQHIGDAFHKNSKKRTQSEHKMLSKFMGIVNYISWLNYCGDSVPKFLEAEIKDMKDRLDIVAKGIKFGGK